MFVLRVTSFKLFVVYNMVNQFQIASAVKEIVSKATGDNFPHIICGDFNSPPMSPGYLVARDGYPSGDETINTLMKIENLELPDGKVCIHFQGITHP